MNRRILTALAAVMLIITSGITGSARKIYNPPFKSRTSSVLTIEEMDLGKKETKVKFRVVFRPGWWLTVDKGAYILDPATGKKFYPTASEGLNFGERFMMPESGDSTFTLIYPPLPKETKTIDFSPNSVFHTFGISLSDKNSKSATTRPEEVLFTSTPRKPTPYFFKGGDVRIHGKLKGYDPRLGFESFPIYYKDILSGNQFMKLIDIDSTGHFDKTLFIPAPTSSFMIFSPGMPIYLSNYLEPDNDLELLLDWEEMLDIDRRKDRELKLKNVQFGGSLAEINRALHFAPKSLLKVSGHQMGNTSFPQEAKSIISRAAANAKREMEKYADEINASPFIRKYLLDMVQMDEAYQLLDYDFYYTDNQEAYPDSALFMNPIQRDFYEDFLPGLLNADTTILASPNASIVLNRLSSQSLPKALSLETDQFGWVAHKEDLDSAITRMAGSDDIPFFWQVHKTARGYNSLVNMAKNQPEYVRSYLNEDLSSISAPVLRKKLEDGVEEAINMNAADLPDSPGGKLLREIIKPYAGKWIFVDFWATTCGPCRWDIENMKDFRELNRDNDKFMFLFITGADESPLSDYNDYVTKNLKDEVSLRLDTKDIDKLRDLFSISAIPHNVLIDPEGRVADDKFSLFMIDNFFKKKEITYKTVPASNKVSGKMKIKIKKVNEIDSVNPKEIDEDIPLKNETEKDDSKKKKKLIINKKVE